MGRGKLVAALVAFLLVAATLWGTILALRLSPQLGLDLQGGVAIILAPAPGQNVDPEVLGQTTEIIRSRVDALGVAEPDIAQQGETIQVQLPGVTNLEQAQEVVGQTAQLQFRPVLEIADPGTPGYRRLEADCGELQAVPPADAEVVLCSQGRIDPTTGETVDEEEGQVPAEERTKFRLGPVAVEGAQVDTARATPDPNLGVEWIVDLGLNGEGGSAFAETTGELACNPPGDVRRQFAIVLDGRVESAPQVAEDVVCEQGITGGQAVITVGGGEEEARQLALVLRTGALPIQLEIQDSRSVSPTLGASSLQAGLLAGFIGLALVAVYLVVLYRGLGLAAMGELAMFGIITYGLIIVLGNTIGFSLTLAGIAGVIVSVGIAADSSIIYRERFKDELRAGRTIRTASEKAFDNAWRTNLTGNTTSFLAAVVLYFLSVGPVRGFAFTLGLSTLIDTLLMATFTRSLFGLIARTPALANSKFMGLRTRVLTPPAEPRKSKAGVR